jgi:hypothetical protein
MTVDDGVLSHSSRVKRDRCFYVPSFPASSPYVTAIGATQVTKSIKIRIIYLSLK